VVVQVGADRQIGSGRCGAHADVGPGDAGEQQQLGEPMTPALSTTSAGEGGVDLPGGCTRRLASAVFDEQPMDVGSAKDGEVGPAAMGVQ